MIIKYFSWVKDIVGKSEEIEIISSDFPTMSLTHEKYLIIIFIIFPINGTTLF